MKSFIAIVILSILNVLIISSSVFGDVISEKKAEKLTKVYTIYYIIYSR